MTTKTSNRKPLGLLLLLAGFGLAQAAQAVDLVAIEGQWSPDGGTTQIPMWGFASDTGQLCDSNPGWSIGPQLSDADLDIDGNLVINLRNCLPEPVSIVIPGQQAMLSPVYDGNRVTSFTAVAAVGGSATYTWNNVRNGTYLYQSGSHPAKQVQMGLYGALTVGSYADTSADVTLLYSEIDPALHNPPAAATPLGYHPRYFLVNGSIDSTVVTAGDTNQPTVLRMLNAGLDYHVPALNGQYMELVAEDGNPYPYARRQYSALLAAGKTIDALWLPEAEGDHVIYDRRGNNMVAFLSATTGVGAPDALDDAYAVDEDTDLVVAAPGVLTNDTGTTAILETTTSNGILALSTDGSFTYTPDADFNGSDSFTYRADDGTLSSSPATVSITVNPVNDGPVAADDAYAMTVGTILTVSAPGVLANDSDIDGDTLVVTTTPLTGPVNGSLVLNSDGSFAYTPTITVAGSDSFTYEACDPALLCASATVSIDIVEPVNQPPVAVEDTATVQRNSAAVFINLTGNDSDPDGNLKDAFGNVSATQITVTTGSSTTRGGTVTVVTNGINYEPKRNFRGTDTFNYLVTDLDGATSNEVTVRINVVK